MSNAVENLVTSIGKLSAIELAQLTKSLQELFGLENISMAAAAPAAAASAGAAPAAAAGEEKTEFKLELVDSGSNKIGVIKVLRKFKKDLGLTEAKDMVDKGSAVVLEGATKAEVDAAKAEFEGAGAKVKVS